MTIRILVAGFQHETNTFAPTPAAYTNFVRGEVFPPLARGQEMLALQDVNIPAGGFMNAALAHGHEIDPVIWAGASPSAPVTRDAYERIAGEIVSAAVSGEHDAIYLDLHGAMVAEHLDDGEGELLGRLRAAVGPTVPIVATLDLHANVTQAMWRHADALDAYRTYPHVDMAETGERAFRLLLARVAARDGWHRATRRVPFLIPINGMCTNLHPANDVYDLLRRRENEAVPSISFAPGFPSADFPECGPTIWAYGEAEAAEAAVDELFCKIEASRTRWMPEFLTPEEAVRRAISLSRQDPRPVVIADTQDNPGAGGDGNTTGMLRALLEAGAEGAVVGVLYDPEAVTKAEAVGVGGRVRLSLGGCPGVTGDGPLVGDYDIDLLSDGNCKILGPMLTGTPVDLGRTAGLRIGGVRVVVSSQKAQTLDRSMLKVGGVDPDSAAIVVVKSSVHFRADFEPTAQAIFVAKAPGPVAADPRDLPWKRLAPGMELSPVGPAFQTPC